MQNTIQGQNRLLPGELASTPQPHNLTQAAEEFEAMFLRSMLQQMRKASDVLAEGNPFASKQQQMMRDIYDDRLAIQLASQRSSGIAQMIINQLTPQQSEKPLKSAPGLAALTSHQVVNRVRAEE